jgi:biopolymer transport protein ExbB/TolQ
MSTSAQNTGKTLSSKILGVVTSAGFMGVMLNVAFFAAVPYSPWQREFLIRYCCGHPINISSQILFFFGMAIYINKLIGLRRERAAVKELGSELSHVSAIDGNEAWVGEFADGHRGTYAAERLQDAVSFRRHNSDGDMRDHLKYLAELALEKLGQSYQFAQTIIWAIPILGFLGTVLGITIAIANVTPDQLESHISEITSGLGVAFDTTAQALLLSLVLVFSSLMVRKKESSVLDAIESMGMQWLPGLLKTPEPMSLQQAETQVAQELVQQSHDLLAFHQRTWHDTLRDSRDRFEHTLAMQSQQLEASLTSAGVETISEQARLMHQFRMETIAQIQQFQEASFTQMMQMRTSFQEQVDELKQIAQLYASLHGQHGQLKVLQESLDHNLQMVQQTDTFQETLETLSAAVQLLGTRVRHAA